jgi:hypothetical protein
LFYELDGFEPSISKWWFDEPTESAKNVAGTAAAPRARAQPE